MKYPPLLTALTTAIALATVQPLAAGTLLDDHFNDGALATNPGTGGGFAFQDNGIGTPGSVSESGSQAAIVEGTGDNTSGIRSSSAFALSNSGLTYTATWQVANLTLGTSGSVRRILLALQTNDSWLFAGGAEESRILIEINKASNQAFLRYQNRSGNSNTNFDSATFDLGTLDNDTDGFTATLVLDSTGFSFTTLGLNATNQVNLTDTWANLSSGGTNFTTALGTDGPMHVAAYIQDNGTTGSPLNIDRITLASETFVAPVALLDDHFNDGVLATNPDTGGGFVFLDNGTNPGTGSVTESGSQARIVDGTGNNTSGIRSSSAFNLSNPGLTYTTTWQVANLTLGTSGSLRRIFLALQTNDSWLFAGDAEESRILVEINKGTNQAFLRYQNRSGNSNTNFDSATFDLGTLGTDTDGFTATLVLDSTGFSFTTLGLNATNQVNLTDTWANLGTGTNFTTALGTDGPMYVAAYTQDSGTTGSPLNIDRIQLFSGGETPNLPVISSFTAGSTTVAPGSTVALSWTAPSFDTLTLDPGGIDAAALTTGGSGSTAVTVNETTTYTLTATLGPESVQSQVTVTARTPASGPNVLVFLVDDMGITDTSVPFIHDGAGNPVTTNFNNFYVTPNMETLASRGMKFTQAYATPACSSTRACLMTGFNTPRHGVCMQVNPTGAIEPNGVAPFTATHSTPNDWKSTGLLAGDAATSMPKVLSDAGYRSIHCGKGHFGSNGSFAADPIAVGFDVNLGGNYRGAPQSYTGNYGGDLPNMGPWENTGTFLTDALTQALNGAMEDAANDGVPFFAYMSHYAVHTPFTTDPNATGNYSAGVNSSHRTFATMIEGMDRSLGSILAKLDQLEIAENTLIIFLGDNGSDSPAATADGLAAGAFSDFPMRGKKATEWEGGVRVPMLASWAKLNAANPFQTALPIAPGSRQDDIVTVWDIFPTVLGVTGVAPPHALDGYDLSPYLSGTPGTHRPQEMLIYWPNDHNEDYFALYRDANWKLIYRFAPDIFELYNLDTDPTESNNLAAANPERVMTMARSMAREFDGGWGGQGILWPTFSQAGARPYPNDPLIMPSIPTVDTDGDGIPDNVEDANFNGLVDPGETDPDNADTDGDGTQDGAEVRTGTDPLNPGSFFKVTPSIDPSGNFIIQWPSKPGALYKIESSETLDGGWSPVADDVPADAVETTTGHDLGPTTSPDRNFFRVMLKD